MFISELIGIPVVDRVQENIGTVRDIIITLEEAFPKVFSLLVRKYKNGKNAVILMSEIDLIGRKFVATKTPAARIPYTSLREGEVLLKRDVLDKQIVDTEGARVIRVNDLKLAKVENEVRLIAADVGMKGLLRRLGWLKFFEFIASIFRRKVADTLIGWDHVEQLKTGPYRGNITVPKKKISEMHPADIANIISQVSSSDEKSAIFRSLSESVAAEALHELEPKLQALLLMTIDTKKVVGILEKMPVDEVADVLGDVTPERAQELLRLLKARKANEVRKLLKHEEETAGGLMTTEFISLPQHLTVEQTIQKLRELAPDAETIYYLYIVDDAGKLVGVLSLRTLIIASSLTPISEIMEKDLITVDESIDQRQVADVISKYNLLAVPVVDKAYRMTGIVTVDDVIDFVLPPMSRRKRHMLG